MLKRQTSTIHDILVIVAWLAVLTDIFAAVA